MMNLLARGLSEGKGDLWEVIYPDRWRHGVSIGKHDEESGTLQDYLESQEVDTAVWIPGIIQNILKYNTARQNYTIT